MRILFLIGLMATLIQICWSQIINVSNCTDLQNIILNNDTIVYNMTQDLYCNSSQYTTIGNSSSFAFKGRLQGNFFSIFDLNIISNSKYLAMFGYGMGSSVYDLKINNLIIDSSNIQYAASLFAYCQNCKFYFTTIYKIISNEKEK